MKKRVLLIMMILCMSCTLIGCDEKENTETGAKIENLTEEPDKTEKELEETIFTDLGKVDINFEYNAIRSFGFNFCVFSTFELDLDKLELEMDSPVDYTFESDIMLEDELNEPSFPLYLSYIGKEGSLDYYDEHGEEYLEDTKNYEKFVKDFPHIYTYNVSVNFGKKDIESGLRFKDVYNDGKINKIILRYNNKEYIYDIGKIRFSSDFENSNDIEGADILDLGTDGVSIDYSSNGKFEMSSDGEFIKTAKDIKVCKIKIMNNLDCSIEEARLIVKSDGNEKEYLLNDGNPVTIKKGSTVKFKIKLKDKEMTGKLGYYSNPLVGMEYEVDGKKEIACWDGKCFVDSFNAYDIYAYMYDGIDVFKNIEKYKKNRYN